VATVKIGWNVVVGADKEKIVEAVKSLKSDNPRPEFYGDGLAAEKIIQYLTAISTKKIQPMES